MITARPGQPAPLRAPPKLPRSAGRRSKPEAAADAGRKQEKSNPKRPHAEDRGRLGASGVQKKTRHQGYPFQRSLMRANWRSPEVKIELVQDNLRCRN